MENDAIVLRQVSWRYGALEALQDVTFHIAEGESVALLGPNGAGKFTAISLVLGLRTPSAGEVRVCGADPRDATTHRHIGAMLQESSLPPGLLVSELLSFYRSLHARPLPLAAVAERARVADLLTRRVERLSGGQRRRVLFALALVGDPDILVLDEPTASMDAESRSQFWTQMDALTASGRTILFTTHYLEEADRHARRVLLLHGGRLIADGTPESLRRRTLRFETAGDCAGRIADLLPQCEVRTKGRSVEVLTDDAEAAVRLLLERGVPLGGLEIATASLEAALQQLLEGAVDR